ncbi:hypothetical protein [Photobacterium sp. J15]|uniref:hypothetical protein n=1 Tax=Photobacterium sp. J15 TaxID=265901 RepID=UPI0007E3FA14|nr:hypothetical protein [Photobacterium sp. J15]
MPGCDGTGPMGNEMKKGRGKKAVKGRNARAGRGCACGQRQDSCARRGFGRGRRGMGFDRTQLSQSE